MQRIAMWSVSCSLSLFVCTGCAAAYIPPPLTTQHPAHPEAMAAPALPPSTTLAYGPSDRPSPQPAMAMAQHGAMAQQGAMGRKWLNSRASRRSWGRGRYL